MALKRPEQRRAEGEGWYTSYGSDADDVLNYLASDMERLEEDEPTYYSGKLFKVTIVVEEV